ncbi:MAG TPA: hypothetical protein VGS20_10245 [Candidatus Acidoferrales bacterium]|nr:hypothetical protein [Candidatus Acidoferrales bacterium]
MACLLERLASFCDLKSEISDLKWRAEGVSHQLPGWADSLQNSRIPGQRYLAEAGKATERACRERAEFLEFVRKNLGESAGGREANLATAAISNLKSQIRRAKEDAP